MNEDPALGGRYRLGELLGVGGSASVFAAEDLRAPVGSPRIAVKILHPHLCADEASREAFLREARHVRQLRHPNVVAVHDSGLHDGGGVTMPWIVLDLLHGPTLREWVVAHGRLAPADAAIVFDGVLAGLAAAHSRGIVHRDLSPQNIVLDGLVVGEPIGSANVRLVDFGLADVTGKSTVGTDVLLARDSVNAGGSVVGNAQFMSPEQAQGLPVRAVSDIYQAGAVLLYALTGSVPFPRETTEQTLRAHVSAPPPVPSAVVPAARPFDRVVTRAMSKTPAHRFRSAAEFRAAMSAAAAAIAAAVPAAAFDGHETDDTDTTGATATTVLPSAGRPLGYLAPADLPTAETAASAARGPGAGIAAVIVGLVVLALAGWGVFSATASPTSAPSPSATSTAPVLADPGPTSQVPTPAPQTPVASSAPSAPTAPADRSIPSLFGTVADADRALRDAGLTLGVVTRVESAESADRVLSQSPVAGSTAAPGSPVHITVASGSNVVPQLAGMTLATATAQLQSAGFTATPSRSGASSTTLVTATQPAAGTVLRVGVAVVVVVADALPAPQPTRGGGAPG